MNDPAASLSRSRPQALIRVLAVALAIAVVAWLVWRAQRDAQRSSAPDEHISGESQIPAHLPSSKSLVLDVDDTGDDKGLLFSSKFGAPLGGQKEQAKATTILPSSKSVIIAPIVPATPTENGGQQRKQ